MFSVFIGKARKSVDSKDEVLVFILRDFELRSSDILNFPSR